MVLRGPVRLLYVSRVCDWTMAAEGASLFPRSGLLLMTNLDKGLVWLIAVRRTT